MNKPAAISLLGGLEHGAAIQKSQLTRQDQAAGRSGRRGSRKYYSRTTSFYNSGQIVQFHRASQLAALKKYLLGMHHIFYDSLVLSFCGMIACTKTAAYKTGMQTAVVGLLRNTLTSGVLPHETPQE